MILVAYLLSLCAVLIPSQHCGLPAAILPEKETKKQKQTKNIYSCFLCHNGLEARWADLTHGWLIFWCRRTQGRVTRWCGILAHLSQQLPQRPVVAALHWESQGSLQFLFKLCLSPVQSTSPTYERCLRLRCMFAFIIVLGTKRTLKEKEMSSSLLILWLYFYNS